MHKTQVLGAALLFAVCSAVGCGDDGDGSGDEVAHAGHDGGHEPELGLPMVPCPATIPEFVATRSGGLEVTGRQGGIVTAKLIDADYSPPRKFRNDWTVLFRDKDGQPLDDIEITKAESYMPVHGHDGKFPPTIEKQEDPGVVFFEDINMHMGGPWEVRFWVESEKAGGTDYIVFDVCIND